MATRSSITVTLPDNTVSSVYCHWDGYLSNNGVILLECYNSQERAEELVRPGSISSLERCCNKPDGHSFDTPVKGFTVYYGRDRGETEYVAPILAENFQAAMRTNSQEYNYLWDGSRWLVDFGRGLVDLATAITEEADAED